MRSARDAPLARYPYDCDQRCAPDPAALHRQSPGNPYCGASPLRQAGTNDLLVHRSGRLLQAARPPRRFAAYQAPKAQCAPLPVGCVHWPPKAARKALSRATHPEQTRASNGVVRASIWARPPRVSGGGSAIHSADAPFAGSGQSFPIMPSATFVKVAIAPSCLSSQPPTFSP